jgi:hypothetical protein
LSDNLDDAKAISRELAQHGWCDLLVGLVQAVERCQGALREIPRSAKAIVKQAMLGSSRQHLRARVTSRVVDVVVDRVWDVFLAAITGGVPVLNALSSENCCGAFGSWRCSSAPPPRTTLKFASTP